MATRPMENCLAMATAPRTLGLLGGMSWESTAVYYRLLNEAVRDRLGPERSAQIVMWSFDFGEIERLQHLGRWDELGSRLAQAAVRLEAAGAEMLLICTNTMHRLFGDVTSAIKAPVLHIADPTAKAICERRIRRVGLLGTAFTMEEPFYRQRLTDLFGLEVLVPEAGDRRLVHETIYHELIAGRIETQSRVAFRRIIEDLVASGAEGVILGCTEIMLLVSQGDTTVPIFDTTALHAAAAASWALEPKVPKQP